MTFAVRLQGITKRFGALTALDAVDLAVEPATIHAVVGENGAGKTTLMRVLYGALRADSGSVEVEGKTAGFNNSADAIRAGIGMVSQHYGIIPALTCLQNLILGAEGGPMVSLRKAEIRARSLAQRMGFTFDWQAEAATLSPAGAQKLEILKLLWREAKIMILDEPTAMLSPADSDALFASMRQLAAEGATVILVTHRLPEVMQHCSRVTVLRSGRLVADRKVSETTSSELARLIVGGDVASHRGPGSASIGESLLKVRALTVLGRAGQSVLKAIDLDLRAGEIVGVAGVDGSGQRELFQAIVGATAIAEGEILIGGQDATSRSAASRIAAGIRLIPEDRHGEGIVEAWSLEENAALGLQRLRPLANGPYVDVPARRAWAQQVADRFHTKHGGLQLPIASLSGGNQQRFVAARALEMRARVILAFQPARGLDINGTEDVYSAIRENCDAGAGALVVSFDLDELLEHCDRIVVLAGGRVLEPSTDKARSREELGRLMVGAA